jgi:hypothetical protein
MCKILGAGGRKEGGKATIEGESVLEWLVTVGCRPPIADHSASRRPVAGRGSQAVRLAPNLQIFFKFNFFWELLCLKKFLKALACSKGLGFLEGGR